MSVYSSERSATDLRVGDVVPELMVTDTIMWRVIKRTKSTCTVALMSDTTKTFRLPSSGDWVVYTEVELQNINTTKTMRLRKDGLFWINSYRVAFAATTMTHPVTGEQVFARRTDYSF
jgi:hypothetical protein